MTHNRPLPTDPTCSGEDTDSRGFPKLDRSSLVARNIEDGSGDVEYWREQTPQARFRAVEMLRRLNYGEDATSGRLQRLLEVAEATYSFSRIDASCAIGS